MPPAIVYFPPYTSTIVQLWNLKICVSSTTYLSKSIIAILAILDSELKKKNMNKMALIVFITIIYSDQGHCVG